MLYSILRLRFSMRFSFSVSVNTDDLLPFPSSSFFSDFSSSICSSLACKVAKEIGRNLCSLAKSSMRVMSTELFPEPKGPVKAMFLICFFSAKDNASFNSVTDLYDASDLSIFLGSSVSIAISTLF